VLIQQCQKVQTNCQITLNKAEANVVEIEMLQKNLKIPDKRYENLHHFENGRNLNGQRYFLFRH
jgi:hypothetical protein